MSGLYLYQTIHLNHGHARQVEAHAAVLDAASRKLFGRRYTPNIHQLTTRIEALATAEHYPQSVSGFVRIELLLDGSERLQPAGVSLYDGYALRSVQPTAISVEYDLSDEAPTSAREAAAQLARQQAAMLGADVALRCDRSGVARTADDAPLFAVRGTTLITSPTVASVERNLGLEALQKAGLTWIEHPIDRAGLSLFDELFYVDHRGVTVLSRCDGHPLMALIAERVAHAMEENFRTTTNFLQIK
ncbi:MAG: aminotransferase class IV [Alistipes sp.]